MTEKKKEEDKKNADLWMLAKEKESGRAGD